MYKVKSSTFVLYLKIIYNTIMLHSNYFTLVNNMVIRIRNLKHKIRVYNLCILIVKLYFPMNTTSSEYKLYVNFSKLDEIKN